MSPTPIQPLYNQFIPVTPVQPLYNPFIPPTPVQQLNNQPVNFGKPPLNPSIPKTPRNSRKKRLKFNDSKKSKNFTNYSSYHLEDEDFKQINNKEFDIVSIHSNCFINEEDLITIETMYVKNKYSQIFNNRLRRFGIMGLDEKDIKLYDTLMKVINSNKTKQNYLVHRFVRKDYLENTFRFTPSSNIYYNLTMIKQQIGSRKIEKGFMSCYMTNKHFIEREIKLEIKIPKGTRAYITRNKEESEIILPCYTEYDITGVEIINNRNKSIIQIYINIINYDKK